MTEDREVCPLYANAAQTIEGAAAWRIGLESGVWLYSSETHPSPGGAMIFRRITTGLDIDAALTRIRPGERVDREAVILLLREMEAGRLEGERLLIAESDS